MFWKHFSPKKKKKNRVLARLKGTQIAICSNPSYFLLKLEKELTAEFHHILKLEEDFWALKSRTEWNMLGDQNTNFFHISTIRRRHHNKIWCLKDGTGSWTYSPGDIENLITSHFISLYTIESICSLSTILFPNIDTPLLHVEDPLLQNITTQEIHVAINSFKPHKASNPDGFHPIFFQCFWHTLGNSICSFIRNVFTNRNIPSELNSTLLCLIPKTLKPEIFHQLRPIGLCNTLYKTITKILLSRLKPHLGDLIHLFQASFILGRKASDNIIIAQEIIHSMTTSKSQVGSMAIKIDLEKAFDRLEWSFIKHTLNHFNFAPCLD